MARESAITIERLRNVYCVPQDHPAPDQLRSQLDRLAQAEVLDASRRALAPWVDDANPSIWLIASIDVDCALDIGAKAASQGAAAWGEQIALAIKRTIERGPGPSVIHFADRAVYLAQWARDMSAGQAWSKWYYQEFDSLRSLPQGAAIAEGIIREGDDALRILLQLHSIQALQTVLAAVSEAGNLRIYAAALPASPVRSKNIARWTSRLLALWSSFAPGLQASLPRGALALAIAALAEWPTQSGDDARGLREAVDGLLKLRRALGAADSPQNALKALQAMVARPREEAEDILAAHALLIDSSLGEFIRQVSGGNPEWATFAAAVIAPDSAAQAPHEDCFLSELGGVFLLASAFRDLEIDLALLAAARGRDDPARSTAILRHLLAVRCLGRSRAPLAIHDRAVAEFAGLPSRVSLSEMAETLAAADVDAALGIVSDALIDRSGENLQVDFEDRHGDYFTVGEIFPELQLDSSRERAWSRLAGLLLRNFAGRLPGFSRSSPEYIFQNFLAGATQLRVETNRIEVRLAQSPLSVVLRIAGMYQNLELPWREGVEICLLAPPA
jgi:hypothetical protein